MELTRKISKSRHRSRERSQFDRFIREQRENSREIRRQFRSLIRLGQVEEEMKFLCYSSSTENSNKDSFFYSTSRIDNSTRTRLRSSSNNSLIRSKKFFDLNDRCCLIEMIYRGNENDDLRIVQNDRTVFRASVKNKDSIRFKSKSNDEQTKLKFEFYLNNKLKQRIDVCCQYSLFDSNLLDFIELKSIYGQDQCNRCQNKTNNIKIQSEKSNDENRINSIDFNQRSKSSSSSNFLSIDQNENVEFPLNSENCSSQRVKNDQDSNKIEFISSEDKSKQEENHLQTEIQLEQNSTKENIEIISTRSIRSSSSSSSEENPIVEDHLDNVKTTNELNQPTLTNNENKKVYGPPQLSTMLSFSETFDYSSFVGNEFFIESTELRFEKEKEFESLKSDDDRRENLDQQIDQKEKQRENIQDSIFSNDHRLSWAQNATELLLTQLGILQERRENVHQTIEQNSREQGNVEYFIIVYLNIVPLNEEDIQLFRSLVNFVKIFDDVNDCLAFINNISNEKILLISSMDLGQSIYSKIKDLQQIFYIYIFEQDLDDQYRYLESQSKIRGFFNRIDEIFSKLNEDVQCSTRDLISYINFDINSIGSETSLVTFEILKEIILNKDESETSIKELIRFSRQQYQNNASELKIIDEFESEYQWDRSIWWMTRPCFISKMINKALKMPDADILYRFRCFIQNLHRQIENESLECPLDCCHIYLGQTIHQSDFDDLIRNSSSSKYFYFSQFLFGTTDFSRSIELAKTLPKAGDDYLPVVLDLDLSNDLQLANRSSLRYLIDEQNEILIQMGVKWKITEINKDKFDELGYLSIHLKSIDEREKTLFQRSIDEQKKEVLSSSPLISLFKLMLLINHSTRAESFIEDLFNDSTIESDSNLQGSLAACCHLLGSTFHLKNDFRRAVHFFILSLKTFTRFVPEDSVQLSPTYNNIGSMYFRLDDYSKALEYHQKALDVQLNSDSPNLSSISSYTNNIGVVYLKQKKSAQAIQSFSRALKVLLEIRTNNYSDIASTYDNLADAFLLQENYQQALNNYLRALEYQHLVETKNAQAFASYNNSIANVYNKLNRYSDALTYFQRALDYQKEYLPLTHPSFASLFNNIGSMFYRQEQYQEALPFYLRSLEIELMTLPDNHPTIAVTHFNIATTYTGLGRFEEAIQSTVKSVEQLLKTLPDDHPEVIENRSYIELIRRKQLLKQLVLQPIDDDQ